MGGETHRSMVVASDYPRLAAGPVGKQIHSIYQDRLRQFTDSGQYKEQGIIGWVRLSFTLTGPSMGC
jgi:alpha-mannosidase